MSHKANHNSKIAEKGGRVGREVTKRSKMDVTRRGGVTFRRLSEIGQERDHEAQWGTSGKRAYLSGSA
jgi:hypothetical protein